MKQNHEKKRHPYRWGVIYGLLLTAYTVFTLLDAFVIPRDIVYLDELSSSSSSSSSEEASTSSEESTQNEPVVTDTSYQSDNISITLTTQRIQDTQVYIADVQLKDASLLRAGLADGAFGRNVGEATSVIAEEVGAILAINGDYYGFRDESFVMRNGYLYRDTARSGYGNDDLVIYEDGTFAIVDEANSDAQALADEGAVQIFSFGPGLVEDGEITVNEATEVEQAMRSNPRTAIGMIEPLHYLLVVSDGRTDESEGLTLMEIAQVMQDLGCQTAYNLDGGGSSTMWFMGEVVNVPTDGRSIRERSVSDIVYIGE